MLVVKVELWPGGDQEQAREIARVGVANVAGRDECDYVVVRAQDGAVDGSWLVAGHRRADGALELVRRALTPPTDPRDTAPTAQTTGGARRLPARLRGTAEQVADHLFAGDTTAVERARRAARYRTHRASTQQRS